MPPPDRNPRPLDLDDEAPERNKAMRPLPSRAPHAGDVWNIVKWALCAVTLVFLIVALTVSLPIDKFTSGGCAFFTAIFARMAQAEQHRYPR